MRRNRLFAAAASAAVIALALAGCGSGSDDDATGGGDTGGTGVITVNGTEPQNPLIPTNTNEVGGGRVVDMLWSGLVYYDAEGKSINEVAESIETEDSQNYTIKLKSGWKFTNGEDVTANSFVDAWNYGALTDNAQLSQYFFESIEGYADVSAEAPTAQTMSGLEVVDDTTFTVKLSQPESDFPLRLGYSAFYPLPKVAFEDMDAFGENPIGNGMYKMAEEKGSWQHDTRIDLVKNDDYKGEQKVTNDGISFVIYESFDAAYSDVLAGNLDVLDTIPDSAFGTYEDDLGERAINQPAAIIQTITIPARLPHFDGEEGNLRRQALSMAIDRDSITETILQGTRTPATDFTSPVIDGYSESLEGNDVLKYNPDQAKTLWAQADAISPWEGTLKFGYNADGSHQAWVDAMANSIKNTLGIDAQGAPSPTFAEIRTQITDRTIEYPFRSGWQGDYPSLYNFLGALYGTGAGSNDGDYSNPEFDELLKQGLGASSVDEANGFFEQSQQVLLKDLPVLPLWYQNAVAGYADTVSDVVVNWKSVPIYNEITKN